jgi:hypothetical protein
VGWSLPQQGKWQLTRKTRHHIMRLLTPRQLSGQSSGEREGIAGPLCQDAVHHDKPQEFRKRQVINTSLKMLLFSACVFFACPTLLLCHYREVASFQVACQLRPVSTLFSIEQLRSSLRHRAAYIYQQQPALLAPAFAEARIARSLQPHCHTSGSALYLVSSYTQSFCYRRSQRHR